MNVMTVNRYCKYMSESRPRSGDYISGGLTPRIGTDGKQMREADGKHGR